MWVLSDRREDASTGEMIYPRGSIAGLPEAHASRRERFLELDELQSGWEVELRGRKGGTTVDASFFSPTGTASQQASIHIRMCRHVHIASSATTIWVVAKSL